MTDKEFYEGTKEGRELANMNRLVAITLWVFILSMFGLLLVAIFFPINGVN